MIFSVLLPMLIGPTVAEKISTAYSATTYVNDYGEILPTPAPHIFLASAAIGIVIVIPLYFLLKEFKDRGWGPVIGSDCHDKRFLKYYFDETEELLKAAGFREIYVLKSTGFEAIPLD